MFRTFREVTLFDPLRIIQSYESKKSKKYQFFDTTNSKYKFDQKRADFKPMKNLVTMCSNGELTLVTHQWGEDFCWTFTTSEIRKLKKEKKKIRKTILKDRKI